MEQGAAGMLAHGMDHDMPLLLWWTWHTGIILTLGAVAACYIIGLRRLWASSGTGRGVSRRQAWAFAGAMAALVIALLSPVDPLSDEFGWMHMVQHKLLMMVAAPLFVLAAPFTVMLFALPIVHRRRFAGALRRFDGLGAGAGRRVRGYLFWHPVVMWVLFAGILWLWHLPALYEAALANSYVHDAQHLMFFGASCLFWRVLLDPLSRLRLSPVLGILYLFTTSLHAMLLGIFMAIAPRVWYPWYEGRTEMWGLAAIEDQQIAGLIMWMPACAVYAIAAAIIFGVWLRPRGEELVPPAEAW